VAVSRRSTGSRVQRIHHDSELLWSELASGPPAPELRDRVRQYTGYNERASAGRRLREIPTGDVTLIVSFGPALAITDPRGGAAVLRRSFVAGLHDRYAVTEAPRNQHGVEVRLTPIVAYTLLGVPMNTLCNRTVALEDVLGTASEELAERLYALPDWEARFDHLDRVLARLLDRGRAPSPSTVWAWRRLEESSGNLSIAALATELGSSRKHINERFRTEVGVPPKTLARVLRFRRAVRLLRNSHLALPDIARRCGYFDQAHLNRDFRQFAGATPREFAASASPAAVA
jgi:AraC-like DNA-binding protein